MRSVDRIDLRIGLPLPDGPFRLWRFTMLKVFCGRYQEAELHGASRKFRQLPLVFVGYLFWRQPTQLRPATCP